MTKPIDAARELATAADELLEYWLLTGSRPLSRAHAMHLREKIDAFRAAEQAEKDKPRPPVTKKRRTTGPVRDARYWNRAGKAPPVQPGITDGMGD